MNSRLVLLAAPWLLGGVLFLSNGCARTPAHRQAVDAASPITFTLWQAKIQKDLTPEEWRWFGVAMQEFKFQLMLDQKMTGSEAIDTAVRTRINGRPFLDVMREGLEAHLMRKTAERDELESAIAINAKRKLPPGDDAMRRELDAHQENLRKKLAALNDELAAVKAALGGFEAKGQA
jgi:hypothetical protein